MIRSFLSRSPLYVLALYASVLIFLVYTCAYAYRKPFTAAIYEGEILWGFDVKIQQSNFGKSKQPYYIIDAVTRFHRRQNTNTDELGKGVADNLRKDIQDFSERSSPGYDLGCHF